MFAEVHSEQEEGWRLEGAAIVIQTNFLLAQREQVNIISPSDRITTTTQAWWCTCGNNRYRGIISYLAQTDANKEGSTIPLIDNLKITEVFKDKDKKEGASVTDFIR